LRLSIRILTNGLFKRRIVARFADLFQEVQISWDGSLANNPRYGSNSRIPRKVWNNLLGLLGAGVSVSVLTVVSAENYLYLRRIVDELYAAGVKHIFLAIEDALGRSAERDTKINYIALEEIYLGLWRDYRAKGIEINLTGTDIHSISPFPCSVPIPNYSMAPDGKISACTIAFNDSDAHAKLFQIGALENGHVSIDNARVLSVREYSVLNMENCRACFAKWHCRGGCPYSKCRRWPYPLTPERCALVRAVVADKVYTTAQ
jgi:radical SAM protein with 4Fe4S-binding SPASM domain